MLKIWTDGSCKNNGYANAAAGYGVYFEGDKYPRISRRLRGKQTNNRAELYAIYSAMKRLYFWSKPCQVHFYIDNKIALNTLLTTRQNGENFDIIEKLYRLRWILIEKGFTITGEWVKAHADSKENHLADKLANAGALKN
jgi:ribonuclease HI